MTGFLGNGNLQGFAGEIIFIFIFVPFVPFSG